ncbi:MAG: hypothetical protein QM715_01145 [Nibricoccus sp.]
MITATHRENPAPSSDDTEADAPLASGSVWNSPAAWTSFAAGFLTLFTVSVGGEMPVGEVLLVVTAGWVVLCALLNRAWPCALLKNKYLWVMLAAQLIALCGYIFSDLYRQSFPRDMARGWSRMIFLAIDIVAIAYLFGRSARNFTVFLVGQCVGCVCSAIVLGPLFGDMWKFGVGTPATFLLFMLAPRAGPLVTGLAALGLGVAHFVLGFRSMGGLCLLTGVLTVLQGSIPVKSRIWLAPFAATAAVAVVLWASTHTSGREEHVTTRSNVERSAMVTAAIEAIKESPLIGHGSWFSNTDVYDNFMLIRRESAREANIGGFPQEYEDPGTTAIHSQLLVAVAEGGLFGGAFFFVFGAGLFLSAFKLVFWTRWNRFAPLCTLFLASAIWSLFFNPFSGAQRVYIALASGLLLLLQTDSFAPHLNAGGEHEAA